MALLQQDLVPASGDSLITLDTDTNLEWLSLKKTANLSISDLRNGAGGYTTTYGFRYANGTELQAFWNHAGITRSAPNQPIPVPDGNSPAIKKLIDWMGGATNYLQTGTTQTQGIFMVPPAPGHAGVGQLWFFTGNPGGHTQPRIFFPRCPKECRRKTIATLRSHRISYALTRPPAPPSDLRAGEQ